MSPDARRRLRELIDAVVADRADGPLVRPVLLTMVQTAITDFERYYDVRHAANRVADHDLLMARNKAQRQRGKA